MELKTRACLGKAKCITNTYQPKSACAFCTDWPGQTFCSLLIFCMSNEQSNSRLCCLINSLPHDKILDWSKLITSQWLLKVPPCLTLRIFSKITCGQIDSLAHTCRHTDWQTALFCRTIKSFWKYRGKRRNAGYPFFLVFPWYFKSYFHGLYNLVLWGKGLTHNQTMTIFDTLEEKAFWKHCGERRKCW